MSVLGNKHIALMAGLALVMSCTDSLLNRDIEVHDLSCEMLVDPVGIDVVYPRLSWTISSGERDLEQTAWQIMVSAKKELLVADSADIWDSGKIRSGQSIRIRYGGKPLESGTVVYWKVRVWTNQGMSEWSRTASWSMGLIQYNDWKGRWIGFDRTFPWDREEQFSRLSARYYRKEFATDPAKEIKRATAYIIGLGLYELYINGQKIGKQVLSPAPTDYSKNVKYNAFEVTDQITGGDNAIGVILGNGRYYTMRQNYKPYKIKNFGYPKMLVNLVLEYSDGSNTVIGSDNSWMGTADGPIRSDNEYDGEIYDARKEMPGWNMPGFDDRKWIPAEYVQEPGGEYEAQMNENMTIMDTIRPVSVKKLGKDTWILDMGQNMTGWLQVSAEGRKGKTIKMRFGESLEKSGALFTTNLRDAIATDYYTLKGEGIEVWHPSFVYHGFRYVEITGYPGTPGIEDFQAHVVYDDMDITGSFASSDTMLNRIFRNAFWSISGNYKGMPVDCPQRNERQPWLGDRAIGSSGESYLFDNSRLYAKWMDDIMYSQKADGSIPDVAPAFWNYYSDNMSWPGTYLLVGNMLYHQYRDLEVLRKHYPYMKKWMDYMKGRYLVDNIMTKDSYGDWCVPPETIEAGKGKSADVKKPSTLISTAYYYYFLQLMQDFARLTGNRNDISYFSNQVPGVFDAFNREFLAEDSSSYGTNTLTDNLLAVSFNLVPESIRPGILERIRDIIDHNNGHLSCGVIGVQWLMRTLSRNGMEDLAYSLATEPGYPGWGYMIENGATTIWELWNGNTAAPDMNSQNHVMLLGDLLVWYFEDLAGIRSHPDYPGFKRIIMNPAFPRGLDSVDASFRSVYGIIASSWIITGDELNWKITVPGNSIAEVYFPTNRKDSITERDSALELSNGIHRITDEENNIILELGSGNYDFKVKLEQK